MLLRCVGDYVDPRLPYFQSGRCGNCGAAADPPRHGCAFNHRCVYSILLQLTIRLGVAKDSFGGDGFANFDFGIKCLSLNETNTTHAVTLRLRMMQRATGIFCRGCLAVFLYPATQIIIHQRCRCIGKPGVLDAMIVWSETLAVAVVILSCLQSHQKSPQIQHSVCSVQLLE